MSISKMTDSANDDDNCNSLSIPNKKLLAPRHSTNLFISKEPTATDTDIDEHCPDRIEVSLDDSDDNILSPCGSYEFFDLSSTPRSLTSFIDHATRAADRTSRVCGSNTSGGLSNLADGTLSDIFLRAVGLGIPLTTCNNNVRSNISGQLDTSLIDDGDDRDEVTGIKTTLSQKLSVEELNNHLLNNSSMSSLGYSTSSDSDMKEPLSFREKADQPALGCDENLFCETEGCGEDESTADPSCYSFDASCVSCNSHDSINHNAAITVFTDLARETGTDLIIAMSYCFGIQIIPTQTTAQP